MRILLACWGTFGEVRPYLWLSRELMQAGHRVTVAGPAIFSRTFDQVAENYLPLPPELGARSHDPAFLGRLFDARQGLEQLLSELLDPAAAAQREAVARLLVGAESQATPFERAFVSWTACGAFVACREAGLPTVQCHLYPQSLFPAEDLPVFMRWPRLTGRLQGGGASRASASQLRAAIHRYAQALMPALTALQVSAGWPPESRGPLPLAAPWPRLALFPESFLKRPEPGVSHLANHWASRTGTPPPAVSRFLDEGPPPVVVSLGSVSAGAPKALLAELAQALEHLGERAVLLLGLLQQGVERRSRSLLLAGDVWPTTVLPRAKAVVHHAGMGSLQEALAQGLPALALPRGFDQLDNAQRLVRLGLGLHLPPALQSGAVLRDSLDALRSDEALASRAETWARERRLEQGVTPEEALALV
jgi:UDP:flavonoid glycosyltransferase YjiC (YdhE family)